MWGWADAGEKVDVSFAGQTKSAMPDASGKWRVKLDALKADAKPQELTVKGKNTLTVKDVLVGEVWLGSGQSNMAMKVSGSNDFGKEQAAANLPQVRMFTVASEASAKAEQDCIGTWVLCSPETVGEFSATLYFFGLEIHKTIGVPTGLIHSSVGGTPIEAWTAAEVQPRSAAAKKKGATPNAEAAAPSAPPVPRAEPVGKEAIGGLFNGKIAPLIPYAIRGAIWSQGENNAKREAAIPRYHQQLTLLITDWRERWGSEFPFAWVQLPNLESPHNRWTLMREQTLKALNVPKTGMAISIDINTDI
ncbi:MAG: sialate O-acetylesterase, partial [Opitutaceae bacterium]